MKTIFRLLFKVAVTVLSADHHIKNKRQVNMKLSTFITLLILLLLAILSLMTSCRTPKYYQQQATLTVNNGRPRFVPSGSKTPLRDTTASVIIITVR